MTQEGFEVHIRAGESDEVYDHDLGAYRPSFIQPILDDLRKADLPAEDNTTEVHSWGYGGDVLAFGLIFTSLATLLLSGKRIEENIDAWIRLGGRFKKALALLRRRHSTVQVSEPVAKSLALHHVAVASSPASDLKVLSSATAPMHNASLTPEAHEIFLEHPERHYVFVIQVGHKTLLILGLDGTGKVAFEHRISLTDFKGYGEE
jgi:hypothetical protein